MLLNLALFMTTACKQLLSITLLSVQDGGELRRCAKQHRLSAFSLATFASDNICFVILVVIGLSCCEYEAVTFTEEKIAIKNACL